MLYVIGVLFAGDGSAQRGRSDTTSDAGASTFVCHAAFRCFQGVAYWNGHVIASTDRDAAFRFENIITMYDLAGNRVSELRAAYTVGDRTGKHMSFGSPTVIGDHLYLTAYNINSGGSPLASRVVRYTLNRETLAIALDRSFGTDGAVNIGGDTAEAVSFHNNEWFVVYHDLDAVRRFNSAWQLQQTHRLSEARSQHGGAQQIVWEGNEAYINMHGPNVYGDADTRRLDHYTWTGKDFNFVESLLPPTYGTTQGYSAAPWGYVWADRPANGVVYTSGGAGAKLSSLPTRHAQRELFKLAKVCKPAAGWQAIRCRGSRAGRPQAGTSVVALSTSRAPAVDDASVAVGAAADLAL